MSMRLWTLLLFLLASVSSGNADNCPKPVLEGNVVLSTSAILQNNFLDGSEVTLECATGYVVDHGSPTITCLNGEWSKQELTCKKLDCGLPKSVPNVQYKIPNGTLFGAYIKPYCNRGYKFYGSSFRQCLVFGWTGRIRCQLVTCGEPFIIPHSIIVSNLTKKILEFEDVIEYRCEDNYALVGNGSVVCQENGTFSTLPECKVECPKLVLEGNVVLSTSAILKNNFLDGSEVTLECATGYVVDHGSPTITCLNGEWSEQELTCKKKDCGHPAPTPNMQYHIPNGTLFGAYITPVCDHGYYLQGSSDRQCLATGWTGRSECVLVTCEDPVNIPNSNKVSILSKEIPEFKDVIEYHCVDNYMLIGNGSVVCQENGTFSSLPECRGSAIAGIAVITVIAGIVGTALYKKKQKGSYDTGEEKKPKYASVQQHFIPI